MIIGQQTISELTQTSHHQTIVVSEVTPKTIAHKSEGEDEPQLKSSIEAVTNFGNVSIRQGIVE